MSMQGWFLVHQMSQSSSWQLHHYVALGIWLFGLLNVLHADQVLINLRKGPSDTGMCIKRTIIYHLMGHGDGGHGIDCKTVVGGSAP